MFRITGRQSIPDHKKYNLLVAPIVATEFSLHETFHFSKNSVLSQTDNSIFRRGKKKGMDAVKEVSRKEVSKA